MNIINLEDLKESYEIIVIFYEYQYIIFP